jgi:hypothetical protein
VRQHRLAGLTALNFRRLQGREMKASVSVPIAGLVWFSTNVGAQPNRELYELQERCSKRAAEVFKREYSHVSNSKHGRLFSYESHYSARLNKCFFLEISVAYEKGQSSGHKLMRLFDLDDTKEYGQYFMNDLYQVGPFPCDVHGKVCRSESEWRELVKPFMED